MSNARYVGWLLLAFAFWKADARWYWFCLWFLLGIWLAKLDRDQKAKSQIPPPSTFDTVDPLDPRPPISRTPYGDNEWIGKLTTICSQYSAPDYFVGAFIPNEKLERANQEYPLEGGETAIALIDTTFFGSASNGMLIGEKGISWKFPFSPQNISTMTWAECSGHMDAISWNRKEESYLKAAGFPICDGLIIPATAIGRKLEPLLRQICQVYKDVFENREVFNLHADNSSTALREPDNIIIPEVLELSQFNINDVLTADFDALLNLPGIGAAEAKIIINHRLLNGPFESMNELETVLSLKPHIVDRLRPIVAFSTVTKKPPEAQLSQPTATTRSDPSPPQQKQSGPIRAPIDF